MKTIKKECQVVLLPTDKSNIIKEMVFLRYFKEILKGDLDSQPYHQYILSDEDIKKGNWFLEYASKDNFYVNPKQATEDITSNNCKKIIATTNPELKITKVINDGTGGLEKTFIDKQLPKPTDQFLQEYVKSPVDKILVDYETLFLDEEGNKVKRLNGNSKHIVQPKVSSNNTISISFVEEEYDWSRYFKKLPRRLHSESEEDYLNRCYTWSLDNFNPPTKK